MAGIRVLIVDDHALFRAGLRLLVAAQPDMAVVGEAEVAVAERRLAQPEAAARAAAPPSPRGARLA